MAFCLVVDIGNGKEPVQNFHRKYDAVQRGLDGMTNACKWNPTINGITWFEIWTNKIDHIDLQTVRHWYNMGYDDKQHSKPSDFGIKARQLEWEVFLLGRSHAKYPQHYKRLF